MTRFPLIVVLMILPVMTMAETPDPDLCGAEGLQSYVGGPVSALAEVTLPEGTRMIGPDTAITRDYRLDRLNIHFDATFQIVRIDCG